jgi:hypothetical protein
MRNVAAIDVAARDAAEDVPRAGNSMAAAS